MKGIQGILFAFGLGIAGAICNWFYLERLAGQQEKVYFIGIRSGEQINPGDPIREDQLTQIAIPRSSVGDLEQVAPRWDYLKTIIGQTSIRAYRGGELVLGQDFQTEAQRDLNEKLGKDERAMWLPVDARSFNPARVNPDNEVSFVLPRARGGEPTPAGSTADAGPAGTHEIIGPFRILEIGSRTGRLDVLRANGGRNASAESSIAVVVKVEHGELEAKARRLLDALATNRGPGLQVLLHPRPSDSPRR